MDFKPLFVRLAALAASLQPLPASALAQPAPPAAADAPSDSAAASRPELDGSTGALLHDTDYPMQAIARREQGTVDMRLSIDPAGKMTRCAITSSSGSAALDTASCQLIGQRARFHPARDAQGRPVAGTAQIRIRWVLPKAVHDEPVETAYAAWARCALDETAKLAPTRLTLRDVTRRALARCGGEEAEAARVLGTELVLTPARNSIRQAIAAQLAQSRRAQEVPARK